jgi:RNA recognition motif. (a.k.a. RRM, RBD, or RNP domain)
MRIFVGNLAWATTEEALSELFGPYGTVDRAQIATWRDNGRSRGFGFVEMPDATEAQAAIAGLNGMWTSRSMGTEMSGRDPMSIGKSNGLFHRLRAPILSPTLHHRVPSPGARAPMRSPGRPLAQLAAQSRKTQAAQTATADPTALHGAPPWVPHTPKNGCCGGRPSLTRPASSSHMGANCTCCMTA